MGRADSDPADGWNCQVLGLVRQGKRTELVNAVDFDAERIGVNEGEHGDPVGGPDFLEEKARPNVRIAFALGKGEVKMRTSKGVFQKNIP